MKIKEMIEDSRPRERFLKYGKEALSNAELFAILLRTGTIQENVVDMSNRLIGEFVVLFGRFNYMCKEAPS